MGSSGLCTWPPDSTRSARRGGADTVVGHTNRNLQEMLDWAIIQTPINIALLDTQMRQLRLNASMCRTLGLRDEAGGLGVTLLDLLSNEATRSMVAAARTVARTGKPAVWKGVNQMPGERRRHAVEVCLSP